MGKELNMGKYRIYLWAECLGLFGGLPLLIYFVRQRWLMIALLWGCALLAYLALKRHNAAYTHAGEWNFAAVKNGLRPVLMRFAVLAPLIFLFAYFHDYERLFSFPLERPHVWAMVMVLYPVLSVWPQEFLYRSYFYHRYKPIFRDHAAYAMATAFFFSYAHIVFNNWVSVVFCAVGGYLFARTYVKSNSLALVCLEHALYGCFIFTIGLGWYFYGAAWRS